MTRPEAPHAAERPVWFMAVTPFDSGGAPDASRLRELAADAIAYGYAAFVVAGGVGEIASLTDGEAVSLASAVSPILTGKCDLYVGVRARSGSAELLRRLRDAGADGVLCFADTSGDAGAAQGLLALVSENDADMAILIDYDGRSFTLDCLRQAALLDPRIAVKYGPADLHGWRRARAELPGVAHWVCGAGDDMAAAFFAVGADFFTSTAANIDPEAISDYAALIGSDRLRRAGAFAEDRLMRLAALRTSRPEYVAATTKAALDLLGRTAGGVRDHRHRFDVADAEELASSVGAFIEVSL